MNYTIGNSTWGDCFVAGNGRIGCVYDLGLDVIVDFMAIENGILKKKDSMIFNFTEKVLFSRGDKNNLGHVLVMGQGATTGKFRIKSSGGSYDPVTPLTTFGTNVCDLLPTINGFDYCVQVSPTLYYDSRNALTHSIPGLPEGTSQGMIQLTSAGIHWSDLWRTAVPQMLWPFEQNGVYIGEGALDPPHIQALENVQKNIYNGVAERPRACYDVETNIFVTASRGPFGVTFNFFNRPLPNLNVDPLPPDPPEPEPEVKLPETVIATLDRFFTENHLPIGEDNIREVIIDADEQVAFEHPNQGYGTKRSGNGNPVSKDTISQRVGNSLRAWDLVSGAGTSAPKLVYKTAESMDITGQVFIGPGDPLDDGAVFTPQDHTDGDVDPPDPPNPPGHDCTPVSPGHDVLEPSFNRIRNFCQNYVAPVDALPEYASKKPYVNDEIHENGLFLSQGLDYFMFGNTGRYAQILMNPTDTRSWDAKVSDAEAALFDYMRKRVGDMH